MRVLLVFILLCSCSCLRSRILSCSMITTKRSNCQQWDSQVKDHCAAIGHAGQGSIPVIRSVLTLVVLPIGLQLCTNIPCSAFDSFEPSTFQPLCPASDGIYYLLKLLGTSTIGPENLLQYGPLIAGALLRVRLEFCVIESFYYEAVIPFIQTNGLSWVLPLKETTETFIAGTVFAVASNAILLGGTKLFTLFAVLLDTLIGLPLRIVANLGKFIPGVGGRNANSANALMAVISLLGGASKVIRETVENVDTFVGRYLTVLTVCYVAFKFAHYKLF